MARGKLTFYIILFLILYATLQFLLLMRHKSGYLSDSYFYKHIAYQFEGYTYLQAKEKIRNQVDYTKQDKITLNIFLNDKAYDNSYTFFAKRPLYPFTISLSNRIFKNEELAMLLPVFISYLATVIIFFAIASKGLNKFFSFVAVFMFMSFYPFLDWSTYYLTDTIGAFFWMSQLLVIYTYLEKKKIKYLKIFTFLLIVSLLNREQSMLILLVTIAIYLFLKLNNNKNLAELGKKHNQLTAIVISGYVGAALLLNQKNILDTIIYTMNSYGLYDRNFSSGQVANYLIESYISSHVHLIKDIASHHLWATTIATAFLGAILWLKKFRLIDALMISSGFASYFAIFLYPVLSYRYFFPTVMSICYFSAVFMSAFLKAVQSSTRTEKSLE